MTAKENKETTKNMSQTKEQDKNPETQLNEMNIEIYLIKSSK